MMIIQVTKIKLLLMKNMRKKIIINLKFHRQIEMIKILFFKLEKSLLTIYKNII